MTASDDPLPPPYLTLSIPQALSLPPPSHPEQATWDSITDVLDHRARYQGDQVACGFAEKIHQEGTWHTSTLTYREIPQVAKRIASQLADIIATAATNCPPTDPQLPPLQPAPVVAILCPSGLDFFVHAIAVWYLGCALLPIAIGTTTDGVRNLLDKTGACALMVHPSQKEIAQESVHGLREGMALIDVVSVEACNSEPMRLQPIAQPDPTSSMIIFHSSGSTGLPKPIYHIHRFWTFSLATAAGTGIAAYTTTPLYHGGMSDFLRSLQAGSSIFFHPITGASNTLSDDQIIAGYHSSQDKSLRPIKYFLSVPFVLEMLSKSEQGLNFLASMHLVSTGGAPLPESTGDHLVVNSNVHLVSRLGSSECGFLMSSFRDYESDKEWSWLRLHDPKGWIDFREDKDNPGLYELIVTSQWPAKLLSNMSDGTGGGGGGGGGAFSTQDLYARHPHHSNWYRYATRVDDTLVLLNGKKFAAGLIETKLRACHELVDDAIVFGSNRALVGAIVIPSKHQHDKYALVQHLTPHLREINKSLPSHAKLTPELIVVADQSLAQSIPRSSKGTLQRGHAYRMLNGLFDEVYAAYENGTIQGFPSRAKMQGQEELIAALLDLIANTLDLTKEQVSPTLDFYRAGMDSISAVRLKAAIHQTIDLGTDSTDSPRKLNTNDIYDHPNVHALARFIAQDAQSADASSSASASEQMIAMVDKYTCKLPSYVARTAPKKGGRKRHMVILTGATGALGSHLLNELLHQPDTVDEVICLVRAQSDDQAQQRVLTSLQSRKVTLSDDQWSRVKCFSADLSRDRNLGISSNLFTTIIQSAQSLSVIHAAWTVNFALSLASFEADNIQGLFNLLSFALQNGVQSFLFCSSLASVLGTPEPTQINEEPSEDPSTAGKVGYSQSKWVAERLCLAAGGGGAKAQQGATVSIARIGQLCSDTQHGVWNESEAWPLLIRTGSHKEVALLPKIQQGIDWLPVDTAARALVHLMSVRHDGADVSAGVSGIFHICLPTSKSSTIPTPTWSDLLTWLQTDAEMDFKICDLSTWLDALRGNVQAIRGRSLIDGIWSRLTPEAHQEQPGGSAAVQVHTDRARQVSSALADARPMDAKLMKKTVSHWRQTGFL